MQTYDIDLDLSDQQKTYLGFLLAITFLGGTLAFVFNKLWSQPPPFLPLWLTLLACTTLSYLLLRAKLTSRSAWVYVVGLMLTFGVSLWHNGPGIVTYF